MEKAVGEAEKRLIEFAGEIRGQDRDAALAASERNDGLLKPLGSLGTLEDIAIKIAGITGKTRNSLRKRLLLIFAADNGICEEGVSGSPPGLTLWHTANIARGISGAGVLSSFAGTDVRVFDVGIDGELKHPDVKNKKIRNGTANFAAGPAMSREEAALAVLTGLEAAMEAADEGYDILGTGEMGIGNTSAASALAMVLCSLSADEAVGRGGGLTDEGLVKKKETIERGIKINSPDPADVLDTLSKVGALEIAAMAGVFLGGAIRNLPVVADGAVSSVAALIAFRINPLVKDYLFLSHKSEEPVYEKISSELGLEPFLNLKMRLGEGSGCPAAFLIIDSACHMLSNMKLFSETGFDGSYRIDIRGDEDGKR